ncbi:hypothetical protein [Streptomyces sp. NBC_00572]|uniref:hypothetical protein n=1 Tax=Streptomyces sp. NBC_00572 TaxID=2903664 RepID=UPI00225A3EE8|nr:hypothetical protein [Streptomyces sp. NBC_00572]MCX4981018.1 hypothetical protein [Streptomyces sp. NBC_00572]
MARIEDDRPYAWGQLYAALLAIKGLAKTGRVEPVAPRQLEATARNPRNICWALLAEAAQQAFLARERGGTVADAAVVVMTDAIRLIPARRVSRGGLDQKQTEEFRRGYEAQLAEYRKAWEGLVG